MPCPGARALARLIAALAWSLLIALAPPAARAQNNAFSSRSLAADPVAQATRGSRSASGGELANVTENPAGPALLGSAQVAFSHLAWAGGLAREWGAIGIPVRPGVVLAGDVSVLHTPALAAYDAQGNETGKCQPMEWSAGSALCGSTGRWQVGAGARIFRLQQAGPPLGGVGFSAGAVRAAGCFRIGAAATDFGPMAEGSGGTYALPSAWRVGIERGDPAGKWILALAW